ncbi:aldo/keto reductase [Streptomyces sp. NBC_01754]|uniref:aldo/keto reductase n=1 Tax=Streptomyces sp. NBC_01754 TaxID=2975930 RepID=UPI002DDB8076|nr:aldo/keto reductase [Streptomyces sp. NBC_01754]WSC90930.1 aldo/keto reductase [Streptomyces sp. NBC_01754]WSC96576.1 aldo/keto reductase [Streptomyces sp. NBC_01754]
MNRQIPFGRTGLRVGRLAVGTVNFGGRTDESEAHRILDGALAHGMNLVDTADMYGWRVHRGYTEELIGRWLRGSSRRRDDVVVATKVGERMGVGPNDRGLSAHHIIQGCEASLRRLGTDRIDLYQMHRYDPDVCWEVVWQAMDQLVRQGKVRYVGSSNFAGWNIADAQHAARGRGLVGLVSEQCAYSLLTRGPELEILPAARAHGLAVLVWAPLHGGLLSGALRKSREGTAAKSAQGRAASALPANHAAVERYERFCAEVGRDPAEVGLAWVLSRPGAPVPVIGPRTVGQLDGALRALEVELSPEELHELEVIFPPVGHGGPAPRAWID